MSRVLAHVLLTVRRTGLCGVAIMLIATLPRLPHVHCQEQNDGLQRIGDASAHGRALKLYEAGRYEEALEQCERAIDDSFPDRIYNRIQATAVRCSLALNRREEALRRVDAIHRRDISSTHLSLIPLVWDHRLPPEECFQPQPNDLMSESVVRRLAAASALLQRAELQKPCVAVLKKVGAEELPPLSRLAEAQLWRLQVEQLETTPVGVVERWQRTAAAWPAAMRAGPQFVVGRALRLRHQPDQAALELLWAPLVAPDDPVLAASSLVEAIECLESAGRLVAARRLRVELQERFAETSSAKRLSSGRRQNSVPATD